MSILDRASLEQSTLADLHAIASELSIDSFRRLRKAELIDVILERQSGERQEDAGAEPEGEEAVGADAEQLIDAEEVAAAVGEEVRARDGEDEGEEPEEAADAAGRRRRGRRGGRGRGRAQEGSESREEEPERAVRDEPAEETAQVPAGDDTGAGAAIEGIVEVLPGGSGFVRVNPPDPSDDDVYISAAQVRRCELVTGDRVTGPRRPPRRSERFASLVRVETVNGQPASDASQSGRLEDMPAGFPSELLPLDREDPTIAAVLSLAPFGRGSRVTIAGPAHTGKTELVRRIAAGLAAGEGLEVRLILAGVRPEEIAELASGTPEPAVSLGLGTSPEARSQAVEAALDQARRVVSRGGHVVLLLDTLDGVHEHVARKTMAAARSVLEGGSLTVIATASQPLGGETTLISLSPHLAAAASFPAIDAVHSWTLRPALLVGESGAEEIARNRAQALSR